MRVLLSAFLLLAACDKPADQTALAEQSGEQSAQIQQLQDRMDKLENAQEAQNARLQVVDATATDTGTQLQSLTNTFNNDVKIDNDRAHGTFNMLQSIDDRLSRYDGQHTTR